MTQAKHQAKENLEPFWTKAKAFFLPLQRRWKTIRASLPASNHPLLVAVVVGLMGTLTIPFSSRYSEIQRWIEIRIQTREELVQYSAAVMNGFRALDQHNVQISSHQIRGREEVQLEIPLQEHVNRMLTAQHILDAHIAFRFRNPRVKARFLEHSKLMREILSDLVDNRMLLRDKQIALRRYWENGMKGINSIAAEMQSDIDLPAMRVYWHVISGRPIDPDPSTCDADGTSSRTPVTKPPVVPTAEGVAPSFPLGTLSPMPVKGKKRPAVPASE
jgi:hypothetical protein